MKVVLVNKFYYNRGGDCTAVFSTQRLLESKGHEVAVFTTKRPQNEYSPWEGYFPEDVEFSFTGFKGKASAAMRIFYSTEVSRKFNALLSDFKPDVVHLHNIHSYISPLVAQIAHKRGVRVVWTLHDYKLICPIYICIRDGRVCEECFRDKSRVFAHKCMKNSRIASFLAWMEALRWNKDRLSKITDTFISPSHFLKAKMMEGGYPGEKIEVLHNFRTDEMAPAVEKEDYYCYVGRLTVEKGVDTLLEAASRLPYRLKIIGGGPLLDEYRARYRCEQIEFAGQIRPSELYPIVRKARLLVIPSVWYENNPFSVIEALCAGTPVLGARIGGIPELIDEGENGFLFTPGSVDELRLKIEECLGYFTSLDIFEKIALDAQNKFGAEPFYSKLMNIYHDH